MSLQEIVIVGGARTPFGKFGGSLRDVTATELGVAAAKGALEAACVPAERVDHVIFGNVIQSSRDAAYLGRHVGLWAGVPQSAPGLTLNRLCGSGFEAIVDAARMIVCGEADVVLAGGAENMSQAPLVARNARWGIGLGEGMNLEDSLWQGLTDSYNNLPMAITAENLAQQYEVTPRGSGQHGAGQPAARGCRVAGRPPGAGSGRRARQGRPRQACHRDRR